MHEAQIRGRSGSALCGRNLEVGQGLSLMLCLRQEREQAHQKDTNPVVGMIAYPCSGSISCSPPAKTLRHNCCQLNWQLEMVLWGRSTEPTKEVERTGFAHPFCDLQAYLVSPMNVRAVVQRQELHVVDLAICVDDLRGVGG